MNRPSPQPRPTPSPRGGFTLIELMIAMAIIVLLIGIALPVFRVLNGSRSQAGATNQIAAMLAQARNDAIGLQVPTGVAFYTDPAGRTNMAEVQSVTPAAWGPASPYAAYSKGAYISYNSNWYVATAAISATQAPTPLPASPSAPASPWQMIDATLVNTGGYLFDQIPDTDAQQLPIGVGAAVLNDYSGGAVDHYLHVGLIVFDLNGRLSIQPWGMARNGLIGTRSNLAGVLVSPQNIVENDLKATTGTPPFGNGSALYSSVGLAVFDGEAASNQGFPPTDSAITNSTATTAETTEQSWLDTNASPLLVNRYNGTPLRSE